LPQPHFLYFAIKYDTGANDRALALSIAQQRMERLRRTPFTDATLNTASSTESYTSAGHPFTILTTIGGTAELKVITVQVTPTSWQQQMGKHSRHNNFPTVDSFRLACIAK